MVKMDNGSFVFFSRKQTKMFIWCIIFFQKMPQMQRVHNEVFSTLGGPVGGRLICVRLEEDCPPTGQRSMSCQS